MKLRLKEYTVSADFAERNDLYIVFDDNQISYNNQTIQDNEKNEGIISLICEYKEEIIKLDMERISNYKGGRQKSINIQFDNDDKEYEIIGNTPSIESVNLYNIIKDKLISIIES